MLYLRLFYEFFKTGLFAVGGGMATIPFLTSMAERTGWFTARQLTDMIAVSESTPGPIGINMSTYVGFTTGGIPGAVIATLGLITPSIIVILIIARILQRFKSSRLVQSAFYGLRPASTGLIAAAGLGVLIPTLLNVELFRSSGSLLSLFRWQEVALAALLLAATNWVPKVKKLHPVFFIAFSALVGIVFHLGGV